MVTKAYWALPKWSKKLGSGVPKWSKKLDSGVPKWSKKLGSGVPKWSKIVHKKRGCGQNAWNMEHCQKL
jgi:hypothetical protein